MGSAEGASEGEEAHALTQHAPARPSPPSRVADPAQVLTPSRREELETLLRRIETLQHDEIWVAVVKSETSPRAADLYARWGLAPDAPRATVLVLLDARARRASIETGQGVEGPLTTLEAERLVAAALPDVTRGAWFAALTQIVRGVAATAVATRARRSAPQQAVDEGGEPAPRGARLSPSAENASDDGAVEEPAPSSPAAPSFFGPWGFFSKLVAAIGGLFLFAVALRQRKKAAERSAASMPSDGDKPKKKYLGPSRIDH